MGCEDFFNWHSGCLERKEGNHLPVDCVVVYENWLSPDGSNLTKAFDQNQYARGLLVVQACVVAHDNVVEQYVDVGDLVRVKRCDEGVRIGDEIALHGDHLQNLSDLNYLSFAQEKIHCPVVFVWLCQRPCEGPDCELVRLLDEVWLLCDITRPLL